MGAGDKAAGMLERRRPGSTQVPGCSFRNLLAEPTAGLTGLSPWFECVQMAGDCQFLPSVSTCSPPRAPVMPQVDPRPSVGAADCQPGQAPGSTRRAPCGAQSPPLCRHSRSPEQSPPPTLPKQQITGEGSFLATAPRCVPKCLAPAWPLASAGEQMAVLLGAGHQCSCDWIGRPGRPHGLSPAHHRASPRSSLVSPCRTAGGCGGSRLQHRVQGLCAGSPSLERQAPWHLV